MLGNSRGTLATAEVLGPAGVGEDVPDDVVVRVPLPTPVTGIGWWRWRSTTFGRVQQE